MPAGTFSFLRDMVSDQEESDAEDDAIISSAQMLKGSKQIQEAVDQRLKELTTLNEKGTFKSQRGGQEQIFVKRQVPWPQNYILSGTAKNRVSYDSLSIFQWVCGLCNIIREQNVKTKTCMLDYMTEIMKDAQDFGWASAKGAHALLLCRMEEGKVEWHMTEKIDRIRRAHAQKWLQLHPPRVKKYRILGKVPHANSFRWVNVPTSVIMSLMVKRNEMQRKTKR